MSAQQPAFGKTVASRPGREREASRAGKGFWYRADWMNLVSDLLMLLAALMFVIAGVRFAATLPLFSLRQVVVVSPMSHVTRAQIEYVASSALKGNYFTVDLDHARQAFENLPWVRGAQLRRVWPGTIEVSLDEHVAAAYWRSADSGDTRLVNTFGELFDAASNASMPVLSGAPETSAQMLSQLKHFNTLLEPMGRKVSAASLSGRQAWQLKLDDGLVLELGKDQARAPLDARFNRFINMWPQISASMPRPIQVADLRYQNGIAVRMAGTEHSNSSAGREKTKGKK